MAAKRIRISKRKGWKMPRDAVSIVRPNRWANPFKLGEKPPFGSVPMDRAETVREFRRLLDANPQMVKNLRRELKGKTLACNCPLDEPCHGDVLLEKANA